MESTNGGTTKAGSDRSSTSGGAREYWGMLDDVRNPIQKPQTSSSSQNDDTHASANNPQAPLAFRALPAAATTVFSSLPPAVDLPAKFTRSLADNDWPFLNFNAAHNNNNNNNNNNEIDNECNHGVPDSITDSDLYDDCVAAIMTCLQGMDRSYQQDVLRRHLHDDKQLEDLQMEKALTELDYLLLFWKHSSRRHFVGPDLVAIGFGMAVDAALVHHNLPLARKLTAVATTLEACVTFGLEQFNGFLDAPHQHTTQLDEWLRGLRKARTSNRALILYLDKKVSCPCLNELKVQARKSPKVDRCHYCRKCFPRDHIKACSNCEHALYCSRECQRKDWKATHKRLCKIVTYPPSC